MSKFNNTFSEEIWNSTYRFGAEASVDDTFMRLATALAKQETNSTFWTSKFFEVLQDFKFVPGGRIISNAGTNISGTSLINCFIPGTKVLTDTGYKPIETIKIGEFVLSHTGNWRRVVSIMNRHFEGDLDVYRSSLLSEDIEVTPEHPFYQGDNKWENSESNQKLVLLKRAEGAKVLISVADYLTDDLKLNLEQSDDLIYLKSVNKKNKSVKKHSFCKKQLILTPELAYAFGRFVGDGSTFSVNKKFTDGFNLIFSKKEIDELNFIKNTLEYNFGIQININKSNQFDGIYLRKNNIIVSTFLRNAFGENSYLKKIPKFIWIAETAIIESFLLGIFDADGCISKRGEAKLVLNNESLIKDVQALMHIVGYHTRITKVKVKGSSAWKLGLTKSQGKAFITSMRKYYVDDRILKELKIPKKKHSVKQQFGTFDDWSEINHFEKSNRFYSGPVHNISVDIDESYVVNNVIVHNCFVDNMLNPDSDSMESIMDGLKRQALILKSEGGYGTSFNVLRPKGAYVSGIANETPGAVAMMELWDKSSEIITMGSGKLSDKLEAKKKIRKGAMLGELDVWHPDIEDFIVAKQTPGKLSKFNLSVGITDEFMDAVVNHKPWNLIFPDYQSQKKLYIKHWDGNLRNWIKIGGKVIVYKTFQDANILWNLITQSTYNRNEPGILFVDRINDLNNLWYCEHIFGTNPCGEQPLPDKGVCLLGNMNLTQYVDLDTRTFKWNEFLEDVSTAVRFMDNVNEVANVPLIEQKESLLNKRRIGLGVMGYASALMLLDLRYGSDEALKFTEQLVSTMANQAYKASALLAKEKGVFPLYDKDLYSKSNYLKVLDEDTLKLIDEHGIRNSHLLSIAPTGNTSAFANTVSGGLEPLFLTSFYRTYIIPNAPDGLQLPTKVDWFNKTAELNGWDWITEGDDNLLTCQFEGTTYKFDKNRGLTKVVLIEDYAYRLLTEEERKRDSVVTSYDLSIEDHIKTMTIFAKYMDAAVSKTINIPENYSFEDFQKVYLDAYNTGYIKGCTTYREGTMMNVLSATNVQNIHKKNNAIKRPKKLDCDIHHLVVKGHAWVVLIGLLDGIPYEVFAFKKKNIKLSSNITKGSLIKVKSGWYDLEFDLFTLENVTELFSQDEEEALTRMISMALRHNVDLKYIIEQLNKAEGTIISFSKAISRTLKRYLTEDTSLGTCPECGSKLIKTEACVKCSSCDYSVC